MDELRPSLGCSYVFTQRGGNWKAYGAFSASELLANPSMEHVCLRFLSLR
jgi:hypothetical protein